MPGWRRNRPEGLTQTILTAADYVFEIGRGPAAAPLRLLTPRATAATIVTAATPWAAAAVLITPGHSYL